MKTTTLCFLKKGDDILLAMKKRGFGEGKWNGAGGKVNEGEDIKIAAARETLEEVGVVVEANKLVSRGHIKFYFENNPDWDLHMHIFTAGEWLGEPAESEEMRPKWYKLNNLPFDQMWPDDKHWFPKLISGERIEGEFLFDGKGEKIISFRLA